jgi:RHS repeat-associated protein
VAIVCGDPSSLDQTNDLVVNGQHLVDPDPREGSFGYRRGDFDGFLVLATVTDGYLHIATDTEAFDPKICFVEIGPEGAVIDQATRDRMDQFIQRASDATFEPANRLAGCRIFAYGSYVDEVLAYASTAEGLTSTYFVHSNHLYSPAALTTAAGSVVERFKYDAYGRQTIMAADGAVRGQSNYAFGRSFTGYVADSETGLCYARARMYSAEMGRFVNRDPLGYVDGYGQYCGYFVPHGIDPMGGRFTTSEHMIDDPPKYGTGYGETTPKFKMEVTCVCSVAEEGQRTWTPKVVSFDLDAKVYVYTTWYNKFGGSDGLNHGLFKRTEANIKRTLDHERVHVRAFREWHDQAEPLAKAEVESLGVFNNQPQCLASVSAVPPKYEGQYHGVAFDQFRHLPPYWPQGHKPVEEHGTPIDPNDVDSGWPMPFGPNN